MHAKTSGNLVECVFSPFRHRTGWVRKQGVAKAVTEGFALGVGHEDGV
jgi:hypothetical protein